MSHDPGFTAAVSTWEMWPRGTKRPRKPITGRGQLARDAWVDAWPRLNGLSFCELKFRRVEEKHEPVKVERRVMRKEARP